MPKIVRKIKFTRKYEVQDHRAGTENAVVYKKGQVRNMNEQSAAHFVARGVADFVDSK